MKKSKAFIEKYLPSYQDAGRVNKPELPPIDPSKLSREQYEALYNQGRVATYDPASGAYQPPMMEGITITADKPKSASDFFDRYNKKANTSADHLLEAMFTVPIDYVTGLPQAAMSYMLDPEKSLTPSEALDITNPVAAFAVDAVTDLADLGGAGLFGDALKLFKGLKRGSKSAKALKEAKNFKSEIDWSKWNEEIPKNKALMKEYNKIEQQAKASGTWMKNPDGSLTKLPSGKTPTPEQWVQSQSKNWEKAYGKKGFDIVDETNRFQWHNNADPTMQPNAHLKGKAMFFTPDESMAEYYNYKPGSNKYITPNNIKGMASGVYNVVVPRTKTLNLDNSGKLWHDMELTDELKNLGVQSKYYNDLMEQNLHLLPNEHGIIPTNTRITTNDIARFIDDNKLGYNRASIYNINDGAVGTVMINKQVPGNYAKSLWGNSGMFDMNDPNIYKAIAPVAAGTAAMQYNRMNQEQPNEFKLGGESSIQKLGYKRNSPHKNRRSININSNLITMDGVDIPLMLVPDNDEPMVAPPNSGQYMFPNSSSVQEIPMGKYRLGGMPCMECGGTVKYQKGGVINRENIKNMPPEMLKAVQRDLKNKGLYTGRIDGIYGPLTDRAITGYNKKSDPTISEKPTQSSSSTAKTNVKWPTQIESKPDDLIYTQTELEKYKDVYKARIEECSKGDAGCLERANRYYNKYVAPLLNLSSSWKELAADRPKGIGQSVDSWDIHGVLRERGGTEIKVPDELKKTIPLKSEYSTKKQEYPLKGKEDLLISMNIPVGSIIGFGTSAGTKKKYGKGTTLYNVEKGLAPTEHSARVVGYNEKGVPVIYDLDRIVPITEYRFPNKGIQLITAPKGAEEMTFEKLKSNPNFLRQPIKVDPKTTPLYKPKEKQKDIVQVEDPNKSKIEKAKDLAGSSIKNLTDSYGITNEEYADLTDEMVNFQKALSGYKQDFANALNISNEEYDELAARAQALAMTETSGGRNLPRKGAYILDKAVKNLSMGIRKGIKMGTSQGITQINEESLFTTPAVANKLRNLGITQSNWNPYDSRHVAAGTLALLKHNQNRAKKYKNSNKLDDLQLDSYYWNNPGALFNGTAEGKSIHSKKYKQFYNQIKNPGQVSSVTSNEPNQSSPRSLKDGGRIESFKNKWLNR